MSKLDDLRNYVAKLFENATDKSVIEQSAVVSSKIDEIVAEQEQQTKNYNELLHDYKEVIVHSSFKPQRNDVGAENPSTVPFDASKTFEDAINAVMDKK